MCQLPSEGALSSSLNRCESFGRLASGGSSEGGRVEGRKGGREEERQRRIDEKMEREREGY